MSAAKERDGFYDAALACPDQASVSLTAWAGGGDGGGAVNAWGCPAGRRLCVKRVSLGLITNTALVSTGPFSIVLRDPGGSPPYAHIIPLVSWPEDTPIRTGAVVNFDLAEGVLLEQDEDLLIAIVGDTVTSGTITVKGGIYGEIV